MVSSIFQPQVGEDHYPIGRFILERTRALRMSRNDLVHRLRYDDIDSGYKALSTALLTGVVAPYIAHHLAEALEIEHAVVGAIIVATMRQKRDEARLDRALWKLKDAISGRSAGSESRGIELTSPLSDRTFKCKQSVRCPRRFSWRLC